MPVRIGLMLYPLVPLILLGAKRGAVSSFVKAGAVSPETARRPASLKANSDQVEAAVKSGLMSTLDDGRSYVNLPAYQRKRRFTMIVLSLCMVGLAALLLWLFPPW